MFDSGLLTGTLSGLRRTLTSRIYCSFANSTLAAIGMPGLHLSRASENSDRPFWLWRCRPNVPQQLRGVPCLPKTAGGYVTRPLCNSLFSNVFLLLATYSRMNCSLTGLRRRQGPSLDNDGDFVSTAPSREGKPLPRSAHLPIRRCGFSQTPSGSRRPAARFPSR